MVISIIGTGYVGLVTGAVFADFGHTVHCIDIDTKKIADLKKGIIPFYEPGLSDLVTRNYHQKRLHFTTDYSDTIPKSEAIFICVGTPPQKNGEPNLEYLFSAAEETAKHLKKYTLIAIKSTVPVGVENELEDLIRKHTNKPFEFASCPEFLKEGSAVEDAMKPDRIVIGTQSKKAEKLLLEIYEPFNGQRVICDLTSAQLIKYAANTFLATKISFANAIANICEKTGADVEVVLGGIKLDKRIGASFLNPGVGYGGSCFPKDLSAFISIAEDYGIDFELLKAVQLINQHQVDLFLEKIEKAIGQLNGKTISVLGLSFKPNTDDIREAPSIRIIQELLKRGAKINAYDPLAEKNTKLVLKNSINYAQDPYQAVKGSSALLIVTEWNEFKELDLGKIKKLMKTPVIIDGRNIYDPKKVKTLGFIYKGIGRS